MFQITLKTARESCGYTQEEVANYCMIRIGEYIKMEIYTVTIPSDILRKIRKLYGIPLDFIKL